ncbi:MAG TPA: hypothetical protein VJ765_11880 [Chitinophagaceae bacterium]|nr:hypothetical protein [Chitinophagaceae bacterium]
MKKLAIILSLFVALGTAAAEPPEVNEKVLKAFKETFTKATDVVWHEMPNSYEARFKQSEVTTKAIYDTNGNLISTTRYYFEENLPIHVLAKVKKKYTGKSVFGVTEITNDEEVTYHITLQDEKNWYVIKSDSRGYLELSKKFRKA